MKRLAVLISGRGSNLGALLDAGLPAQFVTVLSNDPAAAGLDVARARGIPAQALDHRAFSSREAFDRALTDALQAHAPDLVILAGFMRVLTAVFLEAFAGRLINIHPSLLPAFPGLHTHRRALDAGVKLHGCTVHYVTPELDGGPIIAQAAVPVLPDDDERTLATRVLAQEHRLFAQVVRWILEDHVTLEDGRARVLAPVHFPPPACYPEFP